jgi:hypothetical protein
MAIEAKHGIGLITFLFATTLCACADDGDGASGTGDGADGTSEVGTFDGLFENLASGLNFTLDLAVVPHANTGDGDGDGDGDGEPLTGDLFAANYGTSELLLIPDPSGETDPTPAQPFFDGTSEGFRGATAVSIPPDGTIWGAFEQGGEGERGGLVALDSSGQLLARFDGSDHAEAFQNPSGLCFGSHDDSGQLMFMVNLTDGSAWRIDASDGQGSDATFTRVGGGLAEGTPGNPGSPGNTIKSTDLPVGGARGCAYADGSLYVADAQNARVVRFDHADTDSELEGLALEDTPAELLTHPTGVSVNEDGYLLVISSDNAHAFVALELPGGGFVDNGVHDLNVNSGNYAMALANDTIWFARANNTNGTLRAVTPDQETPPNTNSPFPPQ